MEELFITYLATNIDLLKRNYVEFHRFAVWHDIGVTALSASATAILTINKTSGSMYILTLFVPVLTGLVTVFVACDHFFKFRTKADQYKEALRLMLNLQAELAECECNNGVSSENRSKEELYKEARKIMFSIDIIPNIDDRIFYRFPQKK
jgi:hypothetical protein